MLLSSFHGGPCVRLMASQMHALHSRCVEPLPARLRRALSSEPQFVGLWPCKPTIYRCDVPESTLRAHKVSGRALPPDMALSAIFGVPNTFAVRHVTHYHA